MNKGLPTFFLCALCTAVACSSGDIPRAINWELVDDIVRDLYNTVAFNLNFLRIVGRTSVDRDDLGSTLMIQANNAMRSINNTIESLITSITNQDLDVPKARQYQSYVTNAINTLQDNIHTGLGKSGISGLRACDVIKETFDNSMHSFKDLRAALREL